MNHSIFRKFSKFVETIGFSFSATCLCVICAFKWVLSYVQIFQKKYQNAIIIPLIANIHMYNISNSSPLNFMFSAHKFWSLPETDWHPLHFDYFLVQRIWSPSYLSIYWIFNIFFLIECVADPHWRTIDLILLNH